MSSPEFADKGLSEYEKKVRVHALLAATAFLVLIPVGVLIPRYLRTSINQWWWGHAITNFLISGPVAFAAWVMGSKASALSDAPTDHHQMVGIVIFSLYIGQVVIGVFIHFVRIPFPSLGHRPPQNYIHALLGLAILALASYQVHDGIYIEWPLLTGNVHPIKQTIKHAWLAFVIVFWLLYAIGLVFLRRQYTKEREGRLEKDNADV